MKTPVNLFKQALAEKQVQIGLWVGLPNAYSTEICAGDGFDWLLLDGEHAPNDIPTLLAQAQAVAAYPGVQAIARVPMGHGHVGEMLIKQYLDVGIQTLLVPMVDTAAEAQALVRATRYPQDDGKGGIRGMAGARASRWITWTPLPPPKAWTVCSLDRPTYRPPSATLAIRVTPKCKRR